MNVVVTQPIILPPYFDPNDGGLIDIRAELIGYNIMYLHGWLLWTVWSVLGLVQIASVRYMQGFVKLNMFMHIASGLLIFTTTVVMSVLAI